VEKPSIEVIEIEEVHREIKTLKNHKAPGISGLAPKHLKFLSSQTSYFDLLLTNLFNGLIDDASNVEYCKNLYKFKFIGIPKHDSEDLRPIAINEIILNVFHKILGKRLK